MRMGWKNRKRSAVVMGRESFQEVLENLLALGEAGRLTAATIEQRRVRIAFREQSPSTGAFWWPGGRIYLNSRYHPPGQAAGDPGLLSLIVHETCHLRQGWLTALSIYGELEAWQLGFGIFKQLTGRDLPPVLMKLLSLPLGWDRAVLQRARVLMRDYAGKGYRADLLPLYPLHLEAGYRLTGKSPV